MPGHPGRDNAYLFFVLIRDILLQMRDTREMPAYQQLPGTKRMIRDTAIRETAARLQSARTKGELGTLVAREISGYSLFDLQIIGGRLNSDIGKLPSPYREAIGPYFQKQTFRETPRAPFPVPERGIRPYEQPDPRP